MHTTQIIYLLLFPLLWGCSSQTNKKATTVPRPVKVIQVEALGSTNHQYTGVVEATEFSVLAFRVSGTLTEMNVSTGQQVRKGQLIARIKADDFRLNYKTAQTNYATTKSIYERNERLLAANATALQNVEIAKADYIQAESALGMAKQTLGYAQLSAPFSGMIEQKYAENHEEVLAGQPIVRLVNPEEIEVNFILPEESIHLLDLPKIIYIEFDSQKGKLFTSDVKEYIYSSNGSGIPITLRITDKEFTPYRKNVLPGFSCKVIFRVENMISDKYVIPASALFTENSQEYVWIVDTKERVVTKQPVTISRMNGLVLVQQGLSSDDIIVTAGVSSLRDGQKISL